MIAPPTVTETKERMKLVSKNVQRSQAKISNYMETMMMATTIAMW
jgi:hypothetical protein